MPIIVTCPACKAKMKAPDNLVGKMVKCPGCGNAVTVKAAGSSSSLPASAPAPAPKKPVRPAPPPAPPVMETEPIEDEMEASPPMQDDAGEMGNEYPAGEQGGPSTDKERTTAMWIYILPILLSCCGGVGTIISLVMWISKKKDSSFIDYHGKTWLNLLINSFVLTFVLAILAGVLGFVGGFIHHWVGVGFSSLFGFLAFVVSLYFMVMMILSGLKAKKGEWYAPRMVFKLLK